MVCGQSSVVLCFILNSYPKFTLPVAVYFAASVASCFELAYKTEEWLEQMNLRQIGRKAKTLGSIRHGAVQPIINRYPLGENNNHQASALAPQLLIMATKEVGDNWLQRRRQYRQVEHILLIFSSCSAVADLCCYISQCCRVQPRTMQRCLEQPTQYSLCAQRLQWHRSLC